MLAAQYAYESVSVNSPGGRGGGCEGSRLKHSPFLQSLSLLALSLRLDRACVRDGSSSSDEEEKEEFDDGGLAWLVGYVDSVRAMGAVVVAGGGGGRKGSGGGGGGASQGQDVLGGLMERQEKKVVQLDLVYIQ